MEEELDNREEVGPEVKAEEAPAQEEKAPEQEEAPAQEETKPE